ncbi:MAG: protein kinase [Myxococcota bacterium]
MPLDPEAIEARSQALVGEVLGGRYRLDAVLGIGAMGAVFRAYHTGLEREVAVKLLHRDLMASEQMRARFSREAAAISKLDHPNCVRVTDFGSEDDYQYLVMELLQGAPLTAELDQVVPPLRAIELAGQVLAGLEHAHGHGLVHRDVKPDNIFVTHDENGRARLKLLDFGIVKLQEQEGQRQLTQVGMIFGTPHFMSPEQAMGADVDARTDLYALGIVLYAMLAGNLPFDSDDPVKVLRAQIREEPPPLPEGVPAPLREIILRLLAKKPDERYENAAEVREALTAAHQILDPSSAPASVPVSTPGSAPIPVAVAEVPTPVVSASTPTMAEAPSAALAAASAAAVASGAAGGAIAGSGPEASPSSESSPAPSAATPQVPKAALVVPSSGSAPSWWPPSRTVQWMAGGAGLIALVVTIAISAGGDDPKPAPSEPKTPTAAGGGLGALLGGGKDEDDDRKGDSADGPQQEPKIEDDEKNEASVDPLGKELGVKLAGVDVLMEARKYDAARLVLEQHLDGYPDEAILHRRMAEVLVVIGGSSNRKQALVSYSKAISLDEALLDDEAFMEGVTALMNDSKLRAEAVDLAIDHLGSRIDDDLLAWLNVQSRPLGYESRHRIITHLERHGRGEAINRPLQRVHDLWQAREAAEPCQAFGQALDEAISHPDSYLVGTLRRVSVPIVEGSDGRNELCSGLSEKLEQVRDRHEVMFAGIDPVVPKVYRRRKKG